MWDQKAREGDFLETTEGLIFDVKGLVHPPDRIVSFLRYVPSSDGDRERGGVRYKKVYDLKKRWELLRNHYPQYIHFDPYFGTELQAIPLQNVRTHYDPRTKLNDILGKDVYREIYRELVQLVQSLAEQPRVNMSSIGVTGSILVGLQRFDSDIDLMIYGIDQSRNVHQTLKQFLREKTAFRSYALNDLERLYKSRSMEKAMKFQDFCFHERRKVLQGRYGSHDYFIRCVKDWSEVKDIYGHFACQRLGKAKISAEVCDDSESIFTPCIYKIENVKVVGDVKPAPDRLISFRGRFCEQVTVEERLTAMGELERVRTEHDEHLQLVVGESPLDFILAV